MKRIARGFSLVELLTVIGIISILIAMLLPALQRVKVQARNVQCKSNLRQVGIHLLVYANSNNGYLYPPFGGTDVPLDRRWPCFVFKPPVHNPPIMKCPVDVDPATDRSYLVNHHLFENGIRYTSKHINGRTASDIIVMGEKKADQSDYFMAAGEFDRVVDPWKHGLHIGSNYLFLDLHVESKPEFEAKLGIDPWDTSGTNVPTDPT